MATHRIRAFRDGRHTKVTVWSGQRPATLAQNGQLVFLKEEWESFLGLLSRELRSHRLLMKLDRWFKEYLSAHRLSDGSCTECGSFTEEGCDYDCPMEKVREFLAEIRLLAVPPADKLEVE